MNHEIFDYETENGIDVNWKVHRVTAETGMGFLWLVPAGESLYVDDRHKLNPNAKNFGSLQRCDGCGLFLVPNLSGIRCNKDGFTACKKCVEEGRTPQGPRMPSADVPDEYLTAYPETLSPALRAWVLAWPLQHPFVALLGEKGVGKTWAAYAAKNHLDGKNMPVTLLYALDLRDSFVRSFQSGMREKVLEQAITAPRLIIDDLGLAMPSDGWAEALNRIVHKRMEFHRATFITTMTPRSGFRAYGDQFASRLGRFRWNELKGVDRRDGNPIKASPKKPEHITSHAHADAEYKKKLAEILARANAKKKEEAA